VIFSSPQGAGRNNIWLHRLRVRGPPRTLRIVGARPAIQHAAPPARAKRNDRDLIVVRPGSQPHRVHLAHANQEDSFSPWPGSGRRRLLDGRTGAQTLSGAVRAGLEPKTVRTKYISTAPEINHAWGISAGRIDKKGVDCEPRERSEGPGGHYGLACGPELAKRNTAPCLMLGDDDLKADRNYIQEFSMGRTGSGTSKRCGVTPKKAVHYMRRAHPARIGDSRNRHVYSRSMRLPARK